MRMHLLGDLWQIVLVFELTVKQLIFLVATRASSVARSPKLSVDLGQYQGRPADVYLGPFVDVGFNLWLFVYIAVVVLTQT